MIYDNIIHKNGSIYKSEREILEYINQIRNFVLWHYQFGSKYDTPFWDYAKTLTFEDSKFNEFLKYAKDNDRYHLIPTSYGGGTPAHQYGQWPLYSFKNWLDGMAA